MEEFDIKGFAVVNMAFLARAEAHCSFRLICSIARRPLMVARRVLKTPKRR